MLNSTNQALLRRSAELSRYAYKQMMESTLEELEKEYWSEPDFNSHLVTECHRLRKVPLKYFSTEDLRIMLGQKFSVEYLLPLAIDILEKDPLTEGDFYPGDLLKSVLMLPAKEWKKYEPLHARVKNIVKALDEIPSVIKEEINYFSGGRSRQKTAQLNFNVMLSKKG